MRDSDRTRQAYSFGAAAGAYAEHRPDYPAAAVRWALEEAPGPRVLDLGAGTGKLTAVLRDVGVETTAIEPDHAMLAEMRRAVPGVRALTGAAESIPLPDASVDAVVAGNAMHWFDLEGAGPEISRVLVPGGVLAGLWNVVDDRIPWVAELTRVCGPETIGPRDTPAGWRGEAAALDLGRFGSPTQAEFPHRHGRTAGSLVAALATRAGMLVMPGEKRATRLEEIRAFLTSRPETAVGEFDVPLVTCVLRVIGRRPPRRL